MGTYRHKRIPRRQLKLWRRKHGSPHRYMMHGRAQAPIAAMPGPLPNLLGSLLASMGFRVKNPFQPTKPRVADEEQN